MGAKDWYRNTSWSPAIEERFFGKLSRARSQRDQYLVIQALELSERRPDVCVRLVDHYFATRTDSFHDVRAFLARAQALLSRGDIPGAISAYRDVVRCEEQMPSFNVNGHVDLPYLIAVESVSGEYAYALSLLDQGPLEPTFPVVGFKWNAARALILSAIGRGAEASEAARAALDAAGKRNSGFRFHRSLGLVDDSFSGVVERLKVLAA